VDQLLTPIYAWFLFSLGWYLLESILITVFKKKVWGIPHIGWALVIIIAFTFLGGGKVGLGIMILLLIPECRISIASFFKKAYDIYGKKFVIAQRILGGIGCLGLLILIAFNIYININRTPAEFFLRWNGTTPGIVKLRQIIEKKEDALPGLKLIIQQCDTIWLNSIVKYILNKSQSEKDVLYLISVLDIFQEKGYSYEARQIELRLRSLSGLNLKTDIPASNWKKAWEERKKKVEVKDKK
jgi:hypothetical protein